MRRILTTLFAGLFALAASSVSGVWVESFARLESISGTVQPAVDNAQLPGGAFSLRFAPPGGEMLADGSHFSGAADGRYLRWSSATNQALELTTTPLTGSAADGVIRVAFAVRFDALPTVGERIDLLGLQGTGGALAGLAVVDGNLTMVGVNGWLPAQFGAVNAASGWQAGQWRVLAGWLRPSRAGIGEARWWVLDEGPHLLGQATNLTHVRDASEITRLVFMAGFDTRPGAEPTTVALDEVRIYPASEAPTATAFLRAVAADYHAPEPAECWELF